jgi:MFS family permease
VFPGQQAEDGLAILLLVYTVVAAATMVTAGVVSDRSGRRRRSVAVAGVIMAVPAIILALWPTWSATLTAAALLGVGFGIYLSVDQALITQVLPAATGRAKDLGMISVASSAGQALAPAVAAPLVTYLGGYSTLYFFDAGIVLLGSLTIWQVRSVP